MTAPLQLTDRTALLRNRARATQSFMQDLAFAEAQDRLSMVNRAFTDAKIVTGFPKTWQALRPAQLVPDQDVLALTSDSADLVVHAMALHWANDPVGQIIQCRRALRPDGLFLGLALGGRSLQELRAALAQAESDICGGLSPRVLPMADLRDMGALLQRAGLALPVADAQPITVSYQSLWHLMRDLRAMGEGNALAGRLRRPTGRRVFERASTLYQEAYGKDGRIPATFELITLTGWAPAASQPRALRPGSARQRLADALGTPETKLKN